jgi:hypothetical protein
MSNGTRTQSCPPTSHQRKPSRQRRKEAHQTPIATKTFRWQPRNSWRLRILGSAVGLRTGFSESSISIHAQSNSPQMVGRLCMRFLDRTKKVHEFGLCGYLVPLRICFISDHSFFWTVFRIQASLIGRLPSSYQTLFLSSPP